MLASLPRQVWNWLPAFVEIAEAGSIVAAARRMALTPAAVSRTLGLLEDALDRPLFDRVGKRLVLTSAGVALRDAVRTATRAVEAGLVDGDPDHVAGPLRVASLGVLTDHVVVPALLALKRRHPALVPEHHVVGPAEANALLVRGALDVAFYYEELTSDEIAVERLGELTASIYCGRGHPLWAVVRPTRAAVLAHPFSVPRVGDSGRIQDGWPADLARAVGMRITLLATNLQVVLSGTLLTVLPDVTAAPHLARRALRRLPVVTLPTIALFAARHRGALGRRLGQLAIDAARAELPPPRRARG